MHRRQGLRPSLKNHSREKCEAHFTESIFQSRSSSRRTCRGGTENIHQRYGGLPEKVRDVCQRMLRQIYPDRCPVCDRVLYDSRICPACRWKLKYVRQPVCYSCGKPLQNAVQEYCRDCASGHHAFRRGRAVFVYQGAVRGILYRYKYSNRRDYTEFLAQEAAGLYRDWILRQGIEAVVPIPLSRKRQRMRGYNQAEIFAERLAQLCGLPFSAKMLRRIRNTAPQKQLSAEERKNNLKNAFKIEENVVNLKRVLLVDDIYTTGSTIDAAALVLKQSGIEDVFFLCISIGQGE